MEWFWWKIPAELKIPLMKAICWMDPFLTNPRSPRPSAKMNEWWKRKDQSPFVKMNATKYLGSVVTSFRQSQLTEIVILTNAPFQSPPFQLTLYPPPPHSSLVPLTVKIVIPSHRSEKYISFLISAVASEGASVQGCFPDEKERSRFVLGGKI